MAQSPNNQNSLEEEQLEAVRADVGAQIANLTGATDEASFNLKAALEALLNAPNLSAAQIQAAASPLIAQAHAHQTGNTRTQASVAIASVLSEQALADEQDRLIAIERSLFEDGFQTDLHNAFARGGADLVDAHDKATEEALAALERIDKQLAEDGLSTKEKQALLEQRHAVLYAYTGELETLLDRAQERGVEGLGPLAQRIREQKEALEASPLSPEQRAAKIEQASREAAAIASRFDADEQSIIMADATTQETLLISTKEGQEVDDQTLFSHDEADWGDLSNLSAPDRATPTPPSVIDRS